MVINTNPNFKRLRRSMMFLNAQKPSLVKDPYVYKPDSIMLDLEDAVAENQKDAARYSLFHALKEIDYHGCYHGSILFFNSECTEQCSEEGELQDAV